MKRFLLLIITFILCNGCAELLSHRSFVDEMDRETDPIFVPGRDFQVLSGDHGRAHRSEQEIMDRTPASGLTKQEILEERSLYKELRKREMALGPQDRAAYYELMPYFENISEKIYYLRLSRDERREYQDNLFPEENSRMRRGMASYSEDGDELVSERSRGISSLNPYNYLEQSRSELFVGMSKGEVRQSWGGPSRVEVAGNPDEENERWAFYNNGRVQYVYFEGGVVRGWQLD